MLGEYLNQRREAAQEERRWQEEMAHAERMKALELGRPVPEVEVARARAEEVRARAEAGRAIVTGIVAGIVTLGACGVGVGATAVVLQQAAPSLHLPLLALIWICCALVGLAPVAAALLNLRRWPLRLPRPTPEADSIELPTIEADRLRTSIQE